VVTARRNAVAAIATQKVESTQNYLEHAGEDIYGSYVFGDEAQREYLPKPVYKKLRRTIAGLEAFDPSIADAVAQGMKEWALSHGATHYTHWFVPLTGYHGREARLVPQS
jgi:glutamine synthetase